MSVPENLGGLEAPAFNAVAVSPGASPLANRTRAIHVGGAGNLVVTMAGGGDVTFVVTAGAFLPIRVTHVLGATTATGIVALW